MATRLNEPDAHLAGLLAQPVQPATQPAQSVTPAQPAQPGQPATAPSVRVDRRPARRAHHRGIYENVLGRAALLVVLGVISGVWLAGAVLTLRALASWGVPVDQWGAWAYAIPAAITLLEAGTLAFGARSRIVWAVWLAVVAFDALTTAIGLLSVADGHTVAGMALSASDRALWLGSFVLGIVIALAPEPAARAVWAELWS